MKSEKTLNSKGHHDRPDLTGEHIWGDAGQVILLIIFLAVWVIDSFFIHFSTQISDYVPLYVKLPLAIIVFVSGFYMAKVGLKVVFGEERKEPGVIKEGLFGIVRHPIYLAAILFYLGLILLSISLCATIVLIVAIIFYHFIARYEEKLLVQRFGKDYEDYMQRVPMWIPKICK